MESALPLLSGLLMSRACPGDGPPYQVFWLIWMALYGLLGYSWYLSTQGDFSLLLTTLYGALTLLLAFWVFMFGCRNLNIAALWLFMPLTGVLYAIIALLLRSGRAGLIPALLLLPILLWLKFAYYLNFGKVDIIPRHEEEEKVSAKEED